MHYGKIVEDDVANGEGIRVTLFVSGCRNRCKGCFQPETWDFEYGKEFDDTTQAKIIELLSRPYIQGLTLLGGDPMEPENQLALIGLLREVKKIYQDKDIWAYTGYTIEQLTDELSGCRCDVTDEMLTLIDILVDGRFIEGLRDLRLKFRGSSNQRIIDMKEMVLRRTRN